jgi:Zn-dependent peptidase ImmA (M78 family)/DNA-binding XRE family transcriptional regulator
MTQEQVSRAVNVARTTIVAIEKGERIVRHDELQSLVRLYGVSLNEMLRDTKPKVDLAPRFRALPETEISKAEVAITLLNDLASAEMELETLLGRSTVRIYPPERPLAPGDPEQQAEEAALELRHKLGRGLSPLKDLVGLLESELLIRVFVRPIAERSISGLFAYEEEIGACILLNAYHSVVRKRQSAAHETGHFVSGRNRPHIDSAIIDSRSREERFAKRFGFALLMPAPAVRSNFLDFVRDHGRFSPRHLVLMADRYGVSNEALCRRLEDLQLLPAKTWESIRARGFSGDFARGLLDKNSATNTESDDGIVTPRLWFLAAEAHARGLVTEGQLAQMLRLPRLEIRAIIDTLEIEGIADLQTLPGRA